MNGIYNFTWYKASAKTSCGTLYHFFTFSIYHIDEYNYSFDNNPFHHSRGFLPNVCNPMISWSNGSSHALSPRTCMDGMHLESNSIIWTQLTFENLYGHNGVNVICLEQQLCIVVWNYIHPSSVIVGIRIWNSSSIVWCLFVAWNRAWHLWFPS
jgi:hypothetical protein